MASGATPSISPELRSLLRRLKLGRSLDTLPERLSLARSNSLSHAEFLELVFADEVERRDRTSAGLRARAAHLDPTMVLAAWDDTASVTYVYELVVERHRRGSTVITSNRDPVEWLAMMADQLLAQSAIDRLTSARL